MGVGQGQLQAEIALLTSQQNIPTCRCRDCDGSRRDGGARETKVSHALCPHCPTSFPGWLVSSHFAQLTKSKLGDAEADKQRLLRDLEDQATKLQWLQRINSQVRKQEGGGGKGRGREGKGKVTAGDHVCWLCCGCGR